MSAPAVSAREGRWEGGRYNTVYTMYVQCHVKYMYMYLYIVGEPVAFGVCVLTCEQY